MSSLGLDPRLMNLTSPDLSAAGTTAKPANAGKAWEQSQDFEAMFLSSMFQNMFSTIEGDGPLGSTAGVAPWRSFLSQEYGKIVAKAGGIGIADHVYRSLIAMQEGRAS
jgi:flagellar protein FlgJ